MAKPVPSQHPLSDVIDGTPIDGSVVGTVESCIDRGACQTCDPTGGSSQLCVIEESCICPGDELKEPKKGYSVCVNNFEFAPEQETFQSDKLTPNRSRSCSRTTKSGTTGSFDFDFSIYENQPFIDASIFGRDAGNLSTGTVTASVLNGSTYELDSGNFSDYGLYAGLMVYVEGFNTSANNGWRYICAITDGDGTNKSTMTVLSDGIPHENAIQTHDDLVQEIGTTTVQFTAKESVTYASNKRRTFTFQEKHGSEENPLYNLMTGVSLDTFSMSINFAGGKLTGNVGAIGKGNMQHLGSEPDFECTVAENACFHTDDDVELFYGCQRTNCITDFNIDVANNITKTKTSCGTKISEGFFDVTGSITAVYCDQTLDIIQCEEIALPLSIVIWNEDHTEFMNIVLPSVKLTSRGAVSVAQGELTTVTYDFEAQTEVLAGSSLAIQRSYTQLGIVRNRIELCTYHDGFDDDGLGTPEPLTVDVVATGDNEFIINWGDETPIETVTGTTTQLSHDYSASVAPYNNPATQKHVEIYSYSDDPITTLNVSGMKLYDIQLCYLKFLECLDVSENDKMTCLVATDMAFLTKINASVASPKLGLISEVDLQGSCNINNLDLSGQSLTEAYVDYILEHLNTCNLSGGTVNLSGGSNAQPSPTGQALVAQLQAKGWTVTTN